MNEAWQDEARRQTRLDQVWADYLRRLDAGEPLDRDQFLREHEELAEQLEELLIAADRIDLMAGPWLLAEEPQGPSERSAVPVSGLAETVTVVDAGELSQGELRGSAAGAAVSVGPRPWQGPDMVPQMLGDYELLEVIGRGGMGVVYKARQVSMDRVVAVKMVLAGRLASTDDVQRFYREAQAAGKLQHPHIVAIYQVGQIEGQHFYSMEFIEGTTLAELAGRGPLPADRAARYLKAVAEAVHTAHENGILHRDLKPANVLIDKTDQPRVTDFGLAKNLNNESGLTTAGTAVGTPSYMSPEQAAARREEVSARSDVYSLGAILYELLTGRPPFQGQSAVNTIQQVVRQHPSLPSLLNPRADRDLEAICLKCLQKSPQQRYSSAQQLAEDLGRLLDGQPVHARPVSWLRRRAARLGSRWGSSALPRSWTGANGAGAGKWIAPLLVMTLLVLVSFTAWKGSRQLGTAGPASSVADGGDIRGGLDESVPPTAGKGIGGFNEAVSPHSDAEADEDAGHLPPMPILIAAAKRGEMYETVLGDLRALLEELGWTFEMQLTQGSAENAQLLRDSKTHLTLIQSGVVPFKDIGALAPLYHDYVHVMVRKGRGIQSIDDLQTKRIAVGTEGSGMLFSSLLFLDYYEIDPDSPGLIREHFTKLKEDPSLDAAIATTGLENGELKELLRSGEFELLAVTADRAKDMKGAIFDELTIAAGHYKQADGSSHPAVPTLATRNFLAVQKDASDQFVTTILQKLYESDLVERYQMLSPKQAKQWATMGLHPAATEFLKSASGSGK